MDSLILDPESIRLSPEHAFDFDEYSHMLALKKEPEINEMEVCYRVMPFPVKGRFSHKSMELYDSTVAFRPITTVENYAYQKEELFSTPEIYKTGSLSRGITFGSSQNLNVNSAFNFQMDGKLSDNLNIRADITDQNVPFQPEGNTLQLRKFDNVIFEIYNEKLSLKAGDILLKNGDSHFMRYYKNVQGGQSDITYDVNEKISGQSMIAVAAAKGQFSDVTIKAEEGLQGSYQLRVAQRQQFVVVLANSESVYVDGKLLTRGYNYDYTIDYNLGEVTFNPSVPITQFSRIRVTFEYSDQSYSRSILNASQSLTFGNTTINFTYFREKDDENRPISFLLSDADKQQMSNAGDENIPVPISGENPSEYNSQLVLYEKKDTIDLDGNAHSIFTYSRDSTKSLFTVSFSHVGQDSYDLVTNDVNGRVYQWVSPVAGQEQGSYEAVRFVPAPNSRQLMVLDVQTKLSSHVTAFSEIAFSDQNLNLFSDIGNENNKDLAYKLGVKLEDLPIEMLPNYKLSAEVNYERDGVDFKPLDRYRAIEYDRNWSYNPAIDTFATADNIFNSSMSLSKNFFNLLSASYSLRKKDLVIHGFQQDLILKKNFGGLKLSGRHFLMRNENFQEKSNWRKWFGEIFYDKFFVVSGYKLEENRNEVFFSSNDSLFQSAMNFSSHQFYLRNNDSLKMNYRIDYTIREDKTVREGILLPFSDSKTATANLTSQINKSNKLDLTFSYREVQYKPVFEIDDESYILGKLNWQGSLFQNSIRADLSYATSSSREILREFIYVEVASGEGTHAWRDLNEDGVQDLTEFFEAINFDERNYIKVFVPTVEFVSAFNTIFIFTINSQSPRNWRDKGGLKKLLSKISNRTSLNINKKNTNEEFNSRFNPFNLDINNADLIYMRDALRTVFFYNKSGKGLGGDLGYQISHSKQLISRGVESKEVNELSMNLRFHINRELTLTGGIKRSRKENASQFQENYNYVIQGIDYVPGITWQLKSNVRLAANFRNSSKINEQAEGNETSKINAFNMEFRWSNGAKNALTTNFSFTAIDYNGEINSAASYELLEALQPGSNYSWQINYSQKLISGLQLSLGYQGRKSNESRVIQLGRMQVTALF